MDQDTQEFEARALAAEEDLTVLRLCIKDFQTWLADPTHGTVIFRREVIERLSRILAQ